MNGRLENRRVVIRGLELEAGIGAYAHEHGRPQRIRVDVLLELGTGAAADDLATTVSYDDIIAGIRTLLESGHVDLAETLAERIADQCLEDGRVLRATVRVEKPDAVREAEGVGAEVVKVRADAPES